MFLDQTQDRSPEPREELAFMMLLKAASSVACGELVIVSPQGRAHRFEGEHEGPGAVLEVNNPGGLRRVLTRGDTGFAEAFMAGDVDSPDLDALLELGALNESHLSNTLSENRWFRLLQRAIHLLRRNSRAGAKRNVRAHYDLGNDFYGLWLDPGMTYSSAVFEHPRQSLAEAQAGKYRRIMDLLGLRAEHEVLEIGCGWGGFARAAAAETGCTVTGLTLSREQLAHCERLASERGLVSKLRFRIEDYRDTTGQFDHAVSIEMFEAVGEPYWSTYFKALSRRLRPGGRAALQIITIAPEVYQTYRQGCDFIQRYIFPGGMLAPAPLVQKLAAEHGLVTLHQEFHGQDYARTLEHWHRRFLECGAQVRALGFDERFMRMWRYYFSYCRAGFRSGRIDLMQTLLYKPEVNGKEDS